MEVEVLARDLDELADAGIDAAEALARGAGAIGRRRVDGRLDAVGGPADRWPALLDLYAEAEADLRLVRFDFATRAPSFDEAALRHRELTRTVRSLRTTRSPALAAELLQLRAREETLERELRARGLDPRDVAPPLPPERTTDLTYALLHLPRGMQPAGTPPPQQPRGLRRWRR